MFLQDADFESDADLAVLQAKLDQIRSFTAALFLDISDEEKQKYQQGIKQRIKTRTMAGPKGVLPEQGVAEGAKVDRMVKHIAKSEKKLGHSKKEAENIAWATANKRGMLDNKNKKA